MKTSPLKFFQDSFGATRKELSEMTGLHSTTISHILANRREFPRRIKIKFDRVQILVDEALGKKYVSVIPEQQNEIAKKSVAEILERRKYELKLIIFDLRMELNDHRKQYEQLVLQFNNLEYACQKEDLSDQDDTLISWMNYRYKLAIADLQKFSPEHFVSKEAELKGYEAELAWIEEKTAMV